tara:strand:+ start:2823 stop:3242 length:420 start_codon:yes stop_codon:yes gene_type:complete
MRVATWGTGDVTRQSPEEKACGELRGFSTMHASAMVSVATYSIFELARVSLRPIAFRVWIDCSAIHAGLRYYDVPYFSYQQLERARFEQSAVYLCFLQPVWRLLNEQVGRSESEMLVDQARLFPCRVRLLHTLLHTHPT